MKSVRSLKGVKGKYVLVRVDFNVPIQGGKVLDDMRIRVALPTIELLRAKGARVVLVSHIGRKPEESLAPVALRLKKYFPVTFVPAVFGASVDQALFSMEPGSVVLLENLRSEKGEKEGSMAFAKKLASYGDAYVNEAFPVSHRNDASIVGIPKLLPSYAGIQLENEVKELSKILKPKHPFLFILGGAKVETKLPLLKRYLKEADYVFVGGALANNFFRAQGYEVGKSLVDETVSPLGTLLKNEKLLVPSTVVVSKTKMVATNLVGKSESILDIGVPSIEALVPIINSAKLILWNGPMGWYEGGYTQATEKLLSLLSKASADVVIGGGDTAVLVERKKLGKKFKFVSTGGGATLDFLTKGTLPGIKALK